MPGRHRAVVAVVRPRLYYGWVIALALSVTETVSWGIVYYSFSVFLVAMETELAATRAQLSFAFSLALLVSGVAAIPVGRWIDRHGARALMTAGSLAAAALVWAWSRVGSLGELYLIFAALGLAMAAVLYDPAFAVIAKWFNRQRRQALTVLTLVAGLASTIFVPVSAGLLERLGWRPAVAVLAAVLFVLTVPAHALILRRRPEDLGLTPDGERLSPAQGKPPLPPASGGQPARVVMRTKSFWLLTAAFVLNAAVTVAAGVHFIPYLLEQGHPAALAAALAGGIGLMQLPGRAIYGALDRRVPRRFLSAGILALQGASILLLVGAPGLIRLLIFIAIFGMANGMLTLARATTVAELYGPAHYGSISGLMSFWITLARAAGPTLLALLYTAAGGQYTPAFVLSAGVMALAALAYYDAERRAQSFAGEQLA
jgi:MFS family permease